jgi:hypothetical protein
MKSRRHSQGGWSLLEVLAYAGLLLVALNCAAQIFITCTRLHLLGTRTADRATMLEQVEERFVGAVRTAARVVPELGEHRSGDATLVLETPGTAPGEKRYVVLGALRFPNRLSEQVLVDRGGVLTSESLATLPMELASYRFDYGGAPPGTGKRVTLELATVPLREGRPADAPIRLSATPRARLLGGG